MLSTVAGVSLLATLFSAWRNLKQWDAYHHAHISRTQLVNKIFLTLALATATIVFFIFRSAF